MQFQEVNKALQEVLSAVLPSDTLAWIEEKIKFVSKDKSTKDLFLTYSLLASKIHAAVELKYKDGSKVHEYLKTHNANAIQIGRIYFLASVLEADSSFSPKIASIIQVADTGELETFLKFLVLLPNAEVYKATAVDALRTNIATVFDALAMQNLYPALYFSEKQWNQMYLKAAFMERDMSGIWDIDKMANKELARIISDYAHERWAAGREVIPYFWRPVASFLDDELLSDMKRLLESDVMVENKVGALCCGISTNQKAKELLAEYPLLKNQIEENKITWENIK